MSTESPAVNPKKRPAAADTGLEPITKKPTKAKAQEGEKVWTAIDDIVLKEGVQSRIIFPSIAKSANFTVKWAASELQARWRAMLYDPEVADQAARHIASITEKRRRSKWSEAEMALLDRCTEPDFEGFRSLLEKNRPVFHPTRTLSVLEAYGRTVQRAAGSENKWKPLREKAVAASRATPKEKKSISDVTMLEEEISLDRFPWGDHPGLKALIVGTKINYEVTSTPVIIGRRAANPSLEQELHINLSDEGDAGKISRHQATIDFDPVTKKYTIRQLGKATTMVDDLDIRDQGAVTLPEHCTLVFSTLVLEWIERPE